MSDIKIIITGDASGLEAATKKAQAELGKTGIAAQKMGVGLSTASNLSDKVASSVGRLAGTLISGGLIAAVSLAGVALIKMGQSLFEVSKQQKQFNEVLDGAKSVYVKAVLEVDKMRDTFDKARAGIISKKEALKIYNTTIGETIGQTNDLDIAEKNFIANAENYIKFTFLKAAANIALGKAAEAAFNAEAERIKGVKNVTQSQKAGTIRFNLAALVEGNFKEAFRTQTDDQIVDHKIQKFTQLEKTYKDIYASINDMMKKLGFTEQDQANKSVGLTNKRIVALRTIQDVITEMNNQIRFLGTKEVLLNTSEAKEKIKALQSAFDELVKKFRLDEKNPLIIDLSFRINKANIDLATQELLSNIGKSIKDNTANRALIIEPKIVIKPAVFFDSKNFTKEMTDAAIATTAIIQQTATDVFVGIGESIGDAAANQGNFVGTLFSGIFKSIGAGLKQLGIYAITTSKLILGLKATIGTTAGITGGIALIALGTIISAAANKIKAPAFASGVRNFQGGTALVGERGPERVFLPQGSSVQPNNEMNAYGGGGVTLQPSIMYEGTGFRIMLNRVDAQMGRNG